MATGLGLGIALSGKPDRADQIWQQGQAARLRAADAEAKRKAKEKEDDDKNLVKMGDFILNDKGNYSPIQFNYLKQDYQDFWNKIGAEKKVNPNGFLNRVYSEYLPELVNKQKNALQQSEMERSLQQSTKEGSIPSEDFTNYILSGGNTSDFDIERASAQGVQAQIDPSTKRLIINGITPIKSFNFRNAANTFHENMNNQTPISTKDVGNLPGSNGKFGLTDIEYHTANKQAYLNDFTSPEYITSAIGGNYARAKELKATGLNREEIGKKIIEEQSSILDVPITKREKYDKLFPRNNGYGEYNPSANPSDAAFTISSPNTVTEKMITSNLVENGKPNSILGDIMKGSWDADHKYFNYKDQKGQEVTLIPDTDNEGNIIYDDKLVNRKGDQLPKSGTHSINLGSFNNPSVALTPIYNNGTPKSISTAGLVAYDYNTGKEIKVNNQNGTVERVEYKTVGNNKQWYAVVTSTPESGDVDNDPNSKVTGKMLNTSQQEVYLVPLEGSVEKQLNGKTNRKVMDFINQATNNTLRGKGKESFFTAGGYIHKDSKKVGATAPANKTKAKPTKLTGNDLN